MTGGGGEFGGGFVRPPEDRPPPAEALSDGGGRRDSAPEPRRAEPASAPTSGRVPSGMMMSTTSSLEGFRVRKYLGLVEADAILGANIIRDLFAGVRDMVGGRVGGYEKVLAQAKREAIAAMQAKAGVLGANAIVGIDLDYETLQVEGGGSMMMVSVAGTAVQIETA